MNDNQNHQHLIQLLYGKVPLIATCKERPNSLLVVFPDQKIMCKAIEKFTEKYNYDAAQRILPVPGISAILLPIKLPQPDNSNHESLQTVPEAAYLISRGKDFKMPFVQAKTFAGLIKLTDLQFKHIRNKQDFLTSGHTMN